MITDLAIRKLKPSGKRHVVPCGEGLYLRVSAAGKKVFVYRDRAGNSDKWVTIGEYPAVSLAEARGYIERVKSTDITVTVRDAFERYFKTLNYRRPEYVRARMELHFLPVLGSEPIATVTRSDVSAALQRVVDKGSPVAANRLLADVKNLFQYAYERGWTDSNVVEPLRRRTVGGKEESRDRNLSFAEIETFVQLLKNEMGSRKKVGITTLGVMYLLLLTGQRVSEVLESIRNDAKTWSFASKTRPHTVPVSRHARAVVRLLKQYPAPSDARAISKSLSRLLQGSRIQSFTPHDLRRTFASRCADMGVAPHVIEKILNHKMEGVMAVYNRATYWDEQVNAVEKWGRFINVIRKRTPEEASGVKTKEP